MAITAYNIYDIQLMDLSTGKAVSATGTQVSVLSAGTADLATLYDPDSNFASKSNKFAATAGKIRFAVASSVSSVDLCLMAPTGQAIYRTSWVPGQSIIMYDASQRQCVLVAPFSFGEGVATEIDTGFDFPASSIVLPFPAMRVLVADAAITLEAGLKSGESGGDADGFIDAVSVAATGMIKPTLVPTRTLGALLCQLSTGGTVHVPESHAINGTAISLTYTLLTGADTAKGLILQPYMLAGAA